MEMCCEIAMGEHQKVLGSAFKKAGACACNDETKVSSIVYLCGWCWLVVRRCWHAACPLDVTYNRHVHTLHTPLLQVVITHSTSPSHYLDKRKKKKSLRTRASDKQTPVTRASTSSPRVVVMCEHTMAPFLICINLEKMTFTKGMI